VKTIPVLLLLAAAAGAQDLLPPGVLLVSRIKNHIRQEMKRLPDCTCLQTVRRFRKPAGGTMQPLDTVRLEVLFTGHQELYGSPGSGAFSEDPPIAFVSSGMLGDGMFGTFVKNIFIEEAAMFVYRGEEDLADRRVAKYDFRLPSMLSEYRISLPEGSGVAGVKGSFWADPQSFDLVRLEVHTDDLPPALPIEDVVNVMNYAHVDVGGQTILLPETQEVRMVRLNGEESRNTVELTHCRSFQTESTIRTDVEAVAAAVLRTEPTGPAVKVGSAVRTVPAGFLVTVRLKTPITEKSAVGASIEAVVAGDVKSKSGVLIPDGAVVHGRIRRLERSGQAGEYHVVGLELVDIEAGDARLRFFAELQSLDAAGAEWIVSGQTKTTRNATESFWVEDLPGVGAFSVKGKTFELAAGAKMVWKTRALANPAR
jgi:hypothetical protein